MCKWLTKDTASVIQLFVRLAWHMKRCANVLLIILLQVTYEADLSEEKCARKTVQCEMSCTFRANLHENGTTTDPEGRWRSSNFLE
ncbi:predicted protein [Sclerotinia sclerotiorum 1980 UF-70]|uniref:Uncharacterized protein n=1 Tax=Sclerotinia sclerotiorum (strain ATCC 18683 / 1980 / Ss-1) TaxID=665079 RepID=A7EQR5_SCLS1|nr:predicted protein [Sclerotinia sclerotiorum 1980 UF-70]EDN91807.1 predicted protein [Sclerotinia sclerotiorum 1980 UF-70]